MRKCRILLGKLIHQDLVSFRSLLLQIDLQNEATLLIFFLEAAIAADTSERLGILLQIQVVSAGRAEIGFLHLFLFCIGGFLNQILRTLLSAFLLCFTITCFCLFSILCLTSSTTFYWIGRRISIYGSNVRRNRLSMHDC